MTITTIKDLIDKINNDLGDFCKEFAIVRKQLANLGRSPRQDILFKYENEDRAWAINEGGGTEIQYHIFMHDNAIGYGLGFNMQYVQFKNEMSPSDYIRPFCDAFIKISNVMKIKWDEYGFDWIYGNEELLKNPKDGEYALYGKTIEINNDSIDDKAYNEMLQEITGVLFNTYKQVFDMKNNQQIIKNSTAGLIAKCLQLLKSKRNIILQGAPGTGKTYNTAAIALSVLGQTDVDLNDHGAVMKRYQDLCNKEQIFFTTFHQSLDYEDFVEGLKPRVQTDANGNNIGVTYEPVDGIFKRACKNVNKDKSVVLIIDEINRGNVSKIFGELITLLEADKRGDHAIPVTLPYTQKTFTVPSNLYIIGTMNTTDRSTGSIDYALRRRFAFVTLESDVRVVGDHYDAIGNPELKQTATDLFDTIKKFIDNPQHLCSDLGIEDLMVGHSYFMANDEDELKDKVVYEIIPLINEYINDGILNVSAKEKEKAINDWKKTVGIEVKDEEQSEGEE